MAHSRLEKIGTIYTRITGLIQSGAMKLEDRPVWYEVYKAFPPMVPPVYDRPSPNSSVRDIFYKEDVERAKFHKKMGNSLPAINMQEGPMSKPTMCQTFLLEYKRLQTEEGVTEPVAFDQALEKIKGTTRAKDKTVEGSTKLESLVAEFKKAKADPVTRDVKNVDIKDIFK